MSFRNKTNCQRYEYVSYNLITPIVDAVAGQAQRKNGYKFRADSHGDVNPNDLYNAYLELDFKVTNMNKNNYAANSEITVTNGSHSFIQQLKVNYNGINVLDTQDINVLLLKTCLILVTLIQNKSDRRCLIIWTQP